jgi:hypothetical protein
MPDEINIDNRIPEQEPTTRLSEALQRTLEDLARAQWFGDTAIQPSRTTRRTRFQAVDLGTGLDIDPINEKLKMDKKEKKIYKDFEGKVIDDNLVGQTSLGYINITDTRFAKDYFFKGYVCIDPQLIKKHGLNTKVELNTNFDPQGVPQDVKYTCIQAINLGKVARVYDEHAIFKYYVSYAETLTENFKKNYVENLYGDGEFYSINFKSLPEFKRNLKINGVEKDVEFDKFLNDNSKKPFTYKSTLGKKYQFGIEIETISGIVPHYVLEALYCSSVHDGSLRQPDDNVAYGKEYVTCVLQGDLGMLELNRICKELKKRTFVNHKCGVHTHISGPVFNKETIVLMYMIYFHLQNEIYTLLPISRRNNEYCRLLPNLKIDLNLIKEDRYLYIDKYYNEIIKFLSGSSSGNSKEVNKSRNHPKGSKCSFDHSSARYCWVNFVPSVFDTRKNKTYTIEFRPMSGTTSYYNIKNWTLVCMGLVDFIDNYKNEIYNLNNLNNLNLNELLRVVYGNKSAKLINWVNKRKEKFNANALTDVQLQLNEEADYLEGDLDNSVSLKNI